MEELTDYNKLKMRAHEAFIRRASIIDFPFVLKGSYVTRQYFKNPDLRIPADIDWVALQTIDNEEVAGQLFGQWVSAVTELELDDGVKFTPFKENEFWRRIDYAMADDFPTVNTDLSCTVNGVSTYFDLDISFNLDIDYPLVSLDYRPLHGPSFIIPKTVPLGLQVAWKVHQTLVRPRFKDLFDLTYLVQDPRYDKIAFVQSYEALLAECKADNIDLIKLKYFLDYNIEKLFKNNTMQETWDFWRHDINKKAYGGNINYADRGYLVTDLNLLPEHVKDLMKHFKMVMTEAGWTPELIKDLNIPEPPEEKVSLLNQLKKLFKN